MLRSLSVDEVLLRTDSLGQQAVLSDGLGSTIAMVNTGTGAYDPFGQTTSTGIVTSNSFRFRGRENDGTGLYYYRARYYSPFIGRFLSEDPAEAASPNLYAYVHNDPVNSVDPWGLFTISNEIKEDTSWEWRNKCSSSSGGACTLISSKDLSLDCNCNPNDQDCKHDGWKQDLTFHMGGHMYLDSSSSGPASVDPSIIRMGPGRLASLRNHEYNVHINKAKDAVATSLSRYEARVFASQGECETACRTEKDLIPRYFLAVLATTPKY